MPSLKLYKSSCECNDSCESHDIELHISSFHNLNPWKELTWYNSITKKRFIVCGQCRSDTVEKYFTMRTFSVHSLFALQTRHVLKWSFYNSGATKGRNFDQTCHLHLANVFHTLTSDCETSNWVLFLIRLGNLNCYLKHIVEKNCQHIITTLYNIIDNYDAAFSKLNFNRQRRKLCKMNLFKVNSKVINNYERFLWSFKFIFNI